MRRTERPGAARRLAMVALLGLGLATACSAPSDDLPAQTSTPAFQAPSAEEGSVPAPTSDDAPPGNDATPPLNDVTEVLHSGDRAAVSEIIGIPNGVDVDEAALTAVIEGLRHIEFDEATIEQVDDGVVSVLAQVGEQRWIVYLVEEAGGWKIALTEEAS